MRVFNKFFLIGTGLLALSSPMLFASSSDDHQGGPPSNSAPKGVTGPTGPAGPAGLPGAPGVTGPTGPTGGSLVADNFITPCQFRVVRALILLPPTGPNAGATPEFSYTATASSVTLTFTTPEATGTYTVVGTARDTISGLPLPITISRDGSGNVTLTAAGNTAEIAFFAIQCLTS